MNGRIQLAKPRRRPPGLAVAALLAVLAGCAPRYTDYSAFIQQPRPAVSAASYLLEPPDVIQVRSRRVREIDGHSEMIAPDGRINLPLLGPVFVTGKTTEQVAQELHEMAATYYEDADVSVHVVRFNSKKIYVFGEVSTPGSYTYNGTNSVLSMMALAQPTRLADPSKVQVLRPSADGKLVRRMTVDLNKMVKRGETALDAQLLDGDVIYVPANPLAAVGLGLQQLLLPVRPLAETVRGPSDIYDASGAYGPNNNND